MHRNSDGGVMMQFFDPRVTFCLVSGTVMTFDLPGKPGAVLLPNGNLSPQSDRMLATKLTEENMNCFLDQKLSDSLRLSP